MGLTPSYRPDVVESFAARLESRARSVAITATVFGALVGGLLGAAPLTPLDTVWQLPATFGFGTALAGALLGAVAGRAVGLRRADAHRLHAQTVLSQLHAQRATLAIWRLLRAQQESTHAHEFVTQQPPVPVSTLEPQTQPVVPVNEPQVATVPELEPVRAQEPHAEPVRAPEPHVEAVPVASIPLSSPPLPVVEPAPALQPIPLHAVAAAEPQAVPPTSGAPASEPATATAAARPEPDAPPLAPPLQVPLHTVTPPVPTDVHPLFTAPTLDEHQAPADPEPEREVLQALPPAPAQPEPLDPWLVPPLAPPASGS